jgi:hypothetical protein
MGIRFRRSVKIAKGVRLNVSKSGLGLSVGGRGKSISAGPRAGPMPMLVFREPVFHIVKNWINKNKAARNITTDNTLIVIHQISKILP